MTDTVEIRAAARGDEPEWRRLWAGYLAFYEMSVPAHVTDATWTRIIDPASGVVGRVAARDTRLAGFSISVIHPCTWSDKPTCYLEDLYVDASARGSGIGRALIDDLLALAKTHGWSRLYWHTHASNAAARGLYDTYTPADDFVRYRLFLR